MALEALVEQEKRLRLGEPIADGYRRMPQDGDDVETARLAEIRSTEAILLAAAIRLRPARSGP